VEIAGALGAGIVAVVIVSAMVWRRRSTEAQSVAGYRQTLDVLGHLGGADRGVKSRPPGSGRVLRDAASEQSMSGVRADFDDLGTPARQPTGEQKDVPPRRDRSLMVMDRPARRLGAPLAALALVLAAGGAAAYLVVRSHHVTPPAKQAKSSHSHHRAPPATTLPARYTPVTSTASSATYAPATATYSLTLAATTSDCWMSVTSATGTIVLEQTFTAGATASLTLTGHATVVLGAPQSAKLAIGGVPVTLPNGMAGPFTVTFTPS